MGAFLARVGTIAFAAFLVTACSGGGEGGGSGGGSGGGNQAKKTDKEEKCNAPEIKGTDNTELGIDDVMQGATKPILLSAKGDHKEGPLKPKLTVQEGRFGDLVPIPGTDAFQYVPNVKKIAGTPGISKTVTDEIVVNAEDKCGRDTKIVRVDIARPPVLAQQVMPALPLANPALIGPPMPPAPLFIAPASPDYPAEYFMSSAPSVASVPAVVEAPASRHKRLEEDSDELRASLLPTEKLFVKKSFRDTF